MDFTPTPQSCVPPNIFCVFPESLSRVEYCYVVALQHIVDFSILKLFWNLKFLMFKVCGRSWLYIVLLF